MSIHSLERYTENPADFVIFNREKYESMTMIDKYFDDIMKEAEMIYQIITGNPPYGMRIKGSSADLHLKIMENSLNFCSDKLCFIMPSKPIFQQLPEYWYNVFTTSVCTNIETVDKSLFPGTVMEDVAIYHIDRNASSNDYDRQLDVDDKIYNALPDEGKLFIDKMSKVNELEIFKTYKLTDKHNKEQSEKQINKWCNDLIDDKYYLNVSRGNGKFGAKWFSDVLEKENVKTKDEEYEFMKSHNERKNIILCPTKEYGEHLKNLMINGYVLRYGLWLTQTKQDIHQEQFKYVPDKDYTTINDDETLLKECGFTSGEIERMMKYLKDFDFTQNRNNFVRGTEVKPDSYPSSSKVSKPVVDDEDDDNDKFKEYLLDRDSNKVIDET